MSGAVADSLTMSNSIELVRHVRNSTTSRLGAGIGKQQVNAHEGAGREIGS
jgi:hypothetical protein